MIERGIPVIATVTFETETEGSCTARSVLDMNSFARGDARADPKTHAKMRKALMTYLGTQVDMLLDGTASHVEIEARLS